MDKTTEQKHLAQGAVSACLACSIDAIDKASEVIDKLGNQKKLRYHLGRARAEVSSLSKLVEAITDG